MNDSSLLQDFILEAGERIEEFENVWLGIRPGIVERSRLDEAFRPIHTIKSSSSYLGLAQVGELSHEMENLLDIIRKHGKPIDQETIDTLLSCSDRINQLIKDVSESGEEKSTVDDLVETLNRWVNKWGEKSQGAEKEPTSPVEDLKRRTESEALSSGVSSRGDGISEVYEETYDKELFAIFMEQLKAGLNDMRIAVDALMAGETEEKDFHLAHSLLASLRAAANYMGYNALCRHYDGWIEELRSIAAASDADRQPRVRRFFEKDLSFFLEKIDAFFPGAGIGSDNAVQGESHSADDQMPTMDVDERHEEPAFSEALFKDLLEDIFDEESASDADQGDMPEEEEELCLAEETTGNSAGPDPLAHEMADESEGVLQEFVEETQEHLNAFEAALMHLSQSDTHGPDIQEMFRCAHTIKGSARYLGYDAIAELAHHTESVLERLRKKDRPVSAPLLDLLISIHDRLQILTVDLMKRGHINRNTDDIISAIEGYNDTFADEAVPDPTSEELRQSLAEEAEAELLSIFLDQLQSGMDKIGHEIETLGAMADAGEAMERCRSHVAELKSSANYMGYSAFTRFYDNWSLALVDAVNAYDPSDHSAGGELLRSAVVPRLDLLSEVSAPFKAKVPPPHDTTPPDASDEEETSGPIDLLEAFVAAPHQLDTRPMPVPVDAPQDKTDGEAVEEELLAAHPPVADLAGMLDGKLAEFVVPDAHADTDMAQEGAAEDPESGANDETDAIPPDGEPSEEILTSGEPERSLEPVEEEKPADVIRGEGREEKDMADTPIPENKTNAEIPSSMSRINRSIRVDAAKIDTLMNQVGELVVNRASLSQLHNEMKEVQQYFHHHLNLDKKDVKQFRSLYYKLGEAAASLGRVANDLQEGVMKVRMMPISHLFNRYPRLVHDLTRKSDKQVQLEVQGEETELDKMVIERIADPMVHIIRNAVDHGIEPARERAALGKPAAGSIRLHAYHDSNHIVIDIMDDGRGLTLSAIREKAMALGMASREMLEKMTAREIYSLIMNPGFSTAEKITQTSGRGVGMDVVKKNIEKLNGSIEIDSSPGEGTRFRIKIPLTLAIFPALLVRVSDQLYTIPLSSVDETIGIAPDSITTIEGIEVIHLRDVPLPLLRLSSVFSLTPDQQHPDRLFVVVVSTGSQRVGLVVDALVGQEEVVIKPLEDYLQENSGFSGATILGDGRISLILDVYELVNIFMEKKLKTVAAVAV